MTIIYIKFEHIFYTLRVFGTFTNTWPARRDIKKNELFFRNLYYYFAIFILMAVWIPMIIKTYKSRNDISILMKNMSHIAALTEAIFNSILCRIKRKQLQVNVNVLSTNIYVYTYICIYVCIYICIHVYISMCVCMYFLRKKHSNIECKLNFENILSILSVYTED